MVDGQMNERVALVTGARTGVGLALTHALLEKGWQVATLTRTPLTPEPALTRAERAGTLRQYHADLADYASLRAGIAAVREGETRLDVLVNNAGVNPEHFERSPQGREMNAEVNAVVPYILSRELLPLVREGDVRRIVNISSNAARMAKSFDVATLDGDPSAKYRKLLGAYADSKLALSLWTMAVAPELAARGVHILSADPGATKSPLSEGPGMPWVMKMIAKVFFKPPEVAAARIMDLIEDGGRFEAGSYVEKAKVRPLPHADDADAVLAHVERIHRSGFAAA